MPVQPCVLVTSTLAGASSRKDDRGTGFETDMAFGPAVEVAIALYGTDVARDGGGEGRNNGARRCSR
jgi:hypothetical protein